MNEKALLIPKRMIDKSQSYFWTKKWQNAEKEVDEDIKAGRIKKSGSVDRLIEELDS